MKKTRGQKSHATVPLRMGNEWGGSFCEHEGSFVYVHHPILRLRLRLRWAEKLRLRRSFCRSAGLRLRLRRKYEK